MEPSVLILTNGHLCRNPRSLKEAITLGKAGYQVTVVGVRNHPRSDHEDTALLKGAPFRTESLNLLPGAGWASVLARLRIKFLREFAARGIFRPIGSLGPAALLLHRAGQAAAHLTICHNEIAHWAGTRLLARGRRVAADLEDWHSEDLLPADRRARPLALLRSVERTLLVRASHVTTTSDSLAAALQQRYGGKRPAVVSNSFPLQPDPLVKRPSQARPVRFFWFSQTLGPGRGLEAFLRIWSQWEEASEVVLLGEDRGAYGQQLREMIPPDRRDRVHFRPLVSPTDLPAVIAEHDIGLALEDGSIVNRDLTITNKILQYLNAGLAVLATPTAGQREVLAHGPGAGEFFDPSNPAAALAALRRITDDRARLRQRQQAARNLAAARYCWEQEETHLLALVAGSLQSTHRP